jgi:hypothetical protein
VIEVDSSRIPSKYKLRIKICRSCNAPCSEPVEMIIKVLCDEMELLWLGSDPKFQGRNSAIESYRTLMG